MANPMAILPTMDWLDICDAITEEVGEEFRMCSGDIPGLLEYLARIAMERKTAPPIESEEVQSDG